MKRSKANLFACHLEWRTKRNLAAYQELLAALDDHNDDAALQNLSCTVARRDRSEVPPLSNPNEDRSESKTNGKLLAIFWIGAQ